MEVPIFSSGATPDYRRSPGVEGAISLWHEVYPAETKAKQAVFPLTCLEAAGSSTNLKEDGRVVGGRGEMDRRTRRQAEARNCNGIRRREEEGRKAREEREEEKRMTKPTFPKERKCLTL